MTGVWDRSWRVTVVTCLRFLSPRVVHEVESWQELRCAASWQRGGEQGAAARRKALGKELPLGLVVASLAPSGLGRDALSCQVPGFRRPYKAHEVSAKAVDYKGLQERSSWGL